MEGLSDKELLELFDEEEVMSSELLEELKTDHTSIGPDVLRDRFGYHKGTEVTAPMHQAVRGVMLDVGIILDRMLPNGRAKFQAIILLEESTMWANKAIAEMAPVVDE